MNTYTTVQGDTFDSIAFKLFGNEKYIKELMEVNTDHLTTIIFSSGEVLNVPEINVEYNISSDNLPPWRRSQC